MQSKFMYPYSVPAGASVLDADMPDWAEKINIDKLCMAHGYFCILGQLYGTYAAGFNNLFGLEHPMYRASKDTVYGFRVDKQLWINEINQRLANKKKEQGMNFIEAMIHVKNGKKIRHKNWVEYNYIYLDKGQVKFFNGFNFSQIDENQMRSNDFELFDESRPFSELGLGTKFTFTKDFVKIHAKTKIVGTSTHGYVIDNLFYSVNPETKVFVKE